MVSGIKKRAATTAQNINRSDVSGIMSLPPFPALNRIGYSHILSGLKTCFQNIPENFYQFISFGIYRKKCKTLNL